MKLRIQHKVFFSLLAASGLAVFCMYWIMQCSISQGFLQYVNTLEQARLERISALLVQDYEKEGGWDFLRGNAENWMHVLVRSFPDEALNPELQGRIEQRTANLPRSYNRKGDLALLPGAPPKRQAPLPKRGFDARVFLLDAERVAIIGNNVKDEINVAPVVLTLSHEGQTIGYLGLLPNRQLSEVQQLRFVKKQKTAMTLIAGVVLVLCGILSMPFAKRLVRPIQSLTNATHRLAGGDYATRVPVTSSDELGQLACDFNSLALTLEKNETARRQWVADISHELRTPIAILRGEVEALQDGVRIYSPEAIGSLHAEVLHLGRLVDDLYHLSLSDIGAMTYRKEPVAVFSLLEQIIESFQAKCNASRLQLSVSLPETASPMAFADPERLRQLFTNLLENSLKYTGQGGRLEVRGDYGAAAMRLNFLDSAPGVPPEAMGKLFERLFRVEGSRSRSSGGAGLGLAICRNIVEAHEGAIEARPSPLGGLWVAVTLPITGGRI